MNEQVSILVIEDEQSVRDSIAKHFLEHGYLIGTAGDAPEALHQLQDQKWHIIFLDIKIPGMDGKELHEHIRDIDAAPVIIFIADHVSVDAADHALKTGAFDYVTKPIDPNCLSHVVSKAVHQRSLQTENIKLKERIAEFTRINELIGDSLQIRTIVEMIHTIARTDTTVMIHGEQGTGRELIARTIHANSDRRNFPLVSVNCGGLPAAALEEELFGNEQTSTSDTHDRRIGKLATADGGTVFLDEVGNISMKIQIGLLRVIETKHFIRPGTTQKIHTNFRIICTTNKDIEHAVQTGTFREDLYNRLNVFSITLPTLRDRKTDIPLLAKYFIHKYAQAMGKPILSIAPDAMNMLINYQWPGNVRELENAIERAIVVGTPPMIHVHDLPFALTMNKTAPPTSGSLADIERIHITNVLEQNRWNISRSAGILQIDRVTLYNKIQKYGLKRPH